ncbi:unnamed protein product [Schistosoma margrebowiei]|uniref:Uncharacterized protein n=1 Tax=Schistosoma margrebowiei TaxID=48269 RepID=A0A183NAT0_9TREM|nr:unnamed protein product [Schistosoma margrebowiei]
MKDCVDAQLRDQQAGFRKERSCTGQIATLRIIVEQSIEWNSSLYINFVDYEKAFDSVDRTTLWKLPRHYGVPQNIVNIIQSSYDGLHCKIVHGGQLTKSFEVKTGVRQGCLLSPFLFLLVIDWIMKTSTSEGKHGIHWKSRMQLDDLDFADDLALLFQTQKQMQEKTNSVAAASAAPQKADTDVRPELSSKYLKLRSKDLGTGNETLLFDKYTAKHQGINVMSLIMPTDIYRRKVTATNKSTAELFGQSITNENMGERGRPKAHSD